MAYLFLFYCRGVLAGRGFFFPSWFSVYLGGGRKGRRPWGGEGMVGFGVGMHDKGGSSRSKFSFGGKSEIWVVMVVDSGWW